MTIPTVFMKTLRPSPTRSRVEVCSQYQASLTHKMDWSLAEPSAAFDLSQNPVKTRFVLQLSATGNNLAHDDKRQQC